MFEKLKKHLAEISKGEPGNRFQERYHSGRPTLHKQGYVWRLARLFLALVALAVGIPLIFLPGPAFVFFLLAGFLLAAESLLVSRLLDWLELRLRAGWHWLRHRKD